MALEMLTKQLSQIVFALNEIMEKVSRIDRKLERITEANKKIPVPKQETISPEDYE